MTGCATRDIANPGFKFGDSIYQLKIGMSRTKMPPCGIQFHVARNFGR
jgi:hypothetical protein